MVDLRIAIAKGTFVGYGTEERWIDGHTVALDIVPMGSPGEIAEHTHNADGIIVGLQTLKSAEVDRLGDRVRAISRAGIGLDSIDLDAARARGIAVIHQPDYATLEVATHAVAMLLAVNRKLMQADAIAREGWKGRRAITGIRPLDSMRVGVIGAGAIGRAVIDRLRPLVGAVLVHDPYASALPQGVELYENFEEMLAQCDAISLHAPLTVGTRHMLSAREIAMLPKDAVVINVARGELIDTGALIVALQNGHLGGAGLDVFEAEPFAAGHPLTRLDNVLLSPHVGFLSTRAVSRLEEQSLSDLCAFLVERKVYGGRIAVAP